MENWRRTIAKAEGYGPDEQPSDRPVYRSDLRVIVRTVEPLSPDTVKAIADKVQRAYQREVLVEVELDPSLLGGLLIMIGHRVIDMSLRTHLRNMSERIAQRLEDVVKELDQSWERHLGSKVEEFLGEMRRRLDEPQAPAPGSPAPEPGTILAAAPLAEA